MRAKRERKQREELEVNLKLLEKNLSTEENQCLYDKCKRDLEEIILQKEYASGPGVSGMKKMKNPLNFP